MCQVLNIEKKNNSACPNNILMKMSAFWEGTRALIKYQIRWFEIGVQIKRTNKKEMSVNLRLNKLLVQNYTWWLLSLTKVDIFRRNFLPKTKITIEIDRSCNKRESGDIHFSWDKRKPNLTTQYYFYLFQKIFKK